MSTTKLLAVNRMLALIGEYPVDTLPSTLPVASLATASLDRVSAEVQAGDWDFNREEQVRFIPNSAGEIILDTQYWVVNSDGSITILDDVPEEEPLSLPPTPIRIDATNKRFVTVIRGTKLYDKKNHTYVFPDEIECDVVWLLDFENMPEPAKQYVAIRAARKFAAEYLGSQSISALGEDDEFRALATLQSFDSDSGDFNLFDDDYDQSYIVNR